MIPPHEGGREVKAPFYDIEPGDGSYYLCANGCPITRFNELAKAEAVRASYVEEIAAMDERKADELEAALNAASIIQPQNKSAALSPTKSESGDIADEPRSSIGECLS
jgi:hypothetical protein